MEYSLSVHQMMESVPRSVYHLHIGLLGELEVWLLTYKSKVWDVWELFQSVVKVGNMAYDPHVVQGLIHI